jgi:hypothetical protein
MVCSEEVVVYAFYRIRLLNGVVQHVLHREEVYRRIMGRGAGFIGDSTDTAESVDQLCGDHLNRLLCEYRTARDIL